MKEINTTITQIRNLFVFFFLFFIALSEEDLSRRERKTTFFVCGGKQQPRNRTGKEKSITTNTFFFKGLNTYVKYAGGGDVVSTDRVEGTSPRQLRGRLLLLLLR